MANAWRIERVTRESRVPTIRKPNQYLSFSDQFNLQDSSYPHIWSLVDGYLDGCERLFINNVATRCQQIQKLNAFIQFRSFELILKRTCELSWNQLLWCSDHWEPDLQLRSLCVLSGPCNQVHTSPSSLRVFISLIWSVKLVSGQMLRSWDSANKSIQPCQFLLGPEDVPGIRMASRKPHFLL